MSNYRAKGHPIDEAGEIVHVDIDPFIPTGTCAICAEAEQEALPPEDRNHKEPS